MSEGFKWLPPFLREPLDGRINLQRALGSTGWLIADRVLRLGVGLVVSVWVARYMGPDRFGQFNYALALVALFGALATLGLDQIVVHDLIRDRAGAAEILGTTFLLKLIGGGAVFGLSTAMALLARPDDLPTAGLVMVVAAGAMFQAFDAVDLWFQSRVESKYSVYARGAAFAVASALKIWLILNHAPVLAFAAVASLEVALGAAGFVAAYRWRRPATGRWRGSWTRARELLGRSWPYALSGVAVMIYMRIDQIMVRNIAGDHAAGVYAAAWRISELWYFVPTAIVSSIFPSLVATRASNQPLYYARLAKVLRLMAGLGYLVAVVVSLLAGPIVRLFYQSEYAAAAPVLAVHVWAGVFVALGVARGLWDTPEGMMRFSLFTTAGGAVINVALNLVLIPRFGPLGSAVATLISYAFAAVFLCFLHPRGRVIGRMLLRSMFLSGP